MKKFVVILVVLLLLAGAGGGAYWWLFMRGGEPAAEQAEPEAEPLYVELDPLTVPVIRGGAVAKYILLEVTLEVADPAAQELIDARMPRLKDAFLRDLHAFFAARPLDAALNVRTVKKRLMGVSARVLGEGRVVDVLIEGAFEKTG